MALVDHPTGAYRFLPGIAPYSCGAIAQAGFEVVHVTFSRPVPYRRGFDRVAEFLAAQRRPSSALCGVELRCPRPYTFAGFADFNAEYTGLLEDWGVFVNGANPIARTNVAPEVRPPSEPVLYGFSFTRPCAAECPPSFVVAGGGELPEGKLAEHDIVALGDTSASGMAQKTSFVMDLMSHRLAGLGTDWSQVSQLNIYTVHSIAPLLPELILDRIGPAAAHGVHWHYSRPPVAAIEYEMDLRGVRTELRLDEE